MEKVIFCPEIYAAALSVHLKYQPGSVAALYSEEVFYTLTVCGKKTTDVFHNQRNTSITGLFISSSGISELDCATTKTDTAERSISISRESLQAFFLY